MTIGNGSFLDCTNPSSEGLVDFAAISSEGAQMWSSEASIGLDPDRDLECCPKMEVTRRVEEIIVGLRL